MSVPGRSKVWEFREISRPTERPNTKTCKFLKDCTYFEGRKFAQKKISTTWSTRCYVGIVWRGTGSRQNKYNLFTKGQKLFQKSVDCTYLHYPIFFCTREKRNKYNVYFFKKVFGLRKKDCTYFTQGGEMEEIWIEIWGFTEYEVSNLGNVRHTHSKRLVKQSQTLQGVVKVNLMRGGRQTSRSVKVLVAFAFVGGQDDLSDTPIHLDNDAENNRADNIVWRPRWFAYNYTRQFANPEVKMWRHRVRDIDTGVVYSSFMEAATTHGLLIKDIMNSTVMKKETWPTKQIFEVVK